MSYVSSLIFVITTTRASFYSCIEDARVVSRAIRGGEAHKGSSHPLIPGNGAAPRWGIYAEQPEEHAEVREGRGRAWMASARRVPDTAYGRDGHDTFGVCAHDAMSVALLQH